MNCEQVRVWLTAYLDQQVSAEQKHFIEAHLNTCANCQAELVSLHETRSYLTGLMQDVSGSVSAPSYAWDKFQQRLVAEQFSSNHREHSPKAEVLPEKNFIREIYLYMLRGNQRTKMTTTNNTRKQKSMSFTTPLIVSAAGAAVMIAIVSVGILMALSPDRDNETIAEALTPVETQDGSIVTDESTPEDGTSAITEEPTPDNSDSVPTEVPTPVEPIAIPGIGGGGGMGYPDGAGGTLPMFTVGTLLSYDPAADTIEVESLDPTAFPSGIVKLYEHTKVILEDVTWDGVRASRDDLVPGLIVQVEFLIGSNGEGMTPYTYLIFIRSPVPVTDDDRPFELQFSRITRVDAANGIFTLAPEDTIIHYDETTVFLYNDNGIWGGIPAGPEMLVVGEEAYVRVVEGENGSMLASVVVVAADNWERMFDPTPIDATVIGYQDGYLVVETFYGVKLFVITGPEGYAESQGFVFDPGEKIILTGSAETDLFVAWTITRENGDTLILWLDGATPAW